jgi:uncharacterized protein
MANHDVPLTLDPKKFAERQGNLTGQLLIKDLARLKQALTLDQGYVDFTLIGALDVENRPYLQGELHAVVWLTCQRCLEPYREKIDADFMLRPVTNDKEAAMLRAPYEPLLIENTVVELASIIEDEVLLNLPIVAKHGIEECGVAPTVSSSGIETVSKKTNPFTVLAGLKTDKR